eukprot:4645059-Pleurochrysis_carterae.AAC.3
MLHPRELRLHLRREVVVVPAHVHAQPLQHLPRNVGLSVHVLRHVKQRLEIGRRFAQPAGERGGGEDDKVAPCGEKGIEAESRECVCTDRQQRAAAAAAA